MKRRFIQCGMPEDPITGSLNAAISCWLAGQGRLTRPIVLSQGTIKGGPAGCSSARQIDLVAF